MLSQHQGVSTVRVMALLCCAAAIIIAFVGIAKETPDYAGLSMLCGTFLGVSFAGKVGQKAVETKTSPEAGKDPS